MKKDIVWITVWCLFGIIPAYGQMLGPSVIASGGCCASQAGYSLSWTLGEIATETLAGGNSALTQGFQQPEPVSTTGMLIYPPLADGYALEQNYPNPFNPATTIAFTVPEKCAVTLRVYTLSGIHIQTLADGWHEPGYYSVEFHPHELPSGMYSYVLRTTKGIIQRTMLYVK